jgi:hypothetical protein
MGFLRSATRKILPRSIVLAYDDYRQGRLSRRNQRMTTEEVFTDIYTKNRWGGEPGTFNSGNGSHDVDIVSPYVTTVTSELERIGGASMTAVDLGCGDYSVGRELSPFCGRYIGVDIVKPLIVQNQEIFSNDTVSFRHSNIVEDALPEGEICFVRQVLQHLSNDQIAAVLPKLNQFRWCFITEHHPTPARLSKPNDDKPHCDSIRIRRGSGVFLDQPPFNIHTERYGLLLEVPGVLPIDGTDGGVIRTYILKQDSSAQQPLGTGCDSAPRRHPD